MTPPAPRAPRLTALLTLAALLGGCFSVAPRERARTLGKDNVELSGGAAIPVSADGFGLLPHAGLGVGLAEHIDIGIRWEIPYFVLLRGQLQLLDSTRDPLDLSLHVGAGAGLLTSGQWRAGISVGHLFGAVEPWLGLTHSTVGFWGDGGSDIDLSDLPATHMLQPTLGVRLHASERFKFDLHANALLPYTAPEHVAIVGGVDVGAVF